MKTHFLLTCFVASFTMLSGNVHNALTHYAIGFGLWGLFFIRAYFVNKRREAYRYRRYVRHQYYCSWMDKNGYRY